MSLTNPNWTPGRAPQRISWKDKNYAATGNAVSKSTASSTALQKERALSGSRNTTSKGSIKQPKGTYKYGKLAGAGTPDARESRKNINYDGYKPGGDASTEDPYQWLKDLLGSGGGGGGGGSRRAYSDAEVAATSAKLQAIYNRYAADVAAREADIAGYYDKSAANLGSIYDTSAGNVAKAYEAARAAQTQQLQALGLTEHTPVAQFGNETASITALNNLRAAVLAQNEASKGRAITNQRLAAEAAQREGAQAAAQAAQAMASEMVSTGGGGGGGGGGLSPYQYASLILQQQKADSANQYNAARLAAQTAPKPQAAPVDVIGLYNSLVAKGTDPKVASDLAASQARYMGSTSG